jgi:DNA-binding PadR family transcriptional regulator
MHTHRTRTSHCADHHPEGHRRHGGFGPGSGGGFGPGFGPGGRGGFGARRGRRPRGDVRGAVLLLLAEEPRNGYSIMQEIEHRSAGAWRPSPGSVYPLLQQLEEAGLVRSVEEEGRRLIELTDEGREAVEQERESIGEPWKLADDGPWAEVKEARSATMGVLQAANAVFGQGDEAQKARALELLTETRRALYGILAG